jgi:hypothetical protein
MRFDLAYGGAQGWSEVIGRCRARRALVTSNSVDRAVPRVSQKHFADDFRTMGRNDPTMADSYWRDFIQPTSRNLEEVTLVLRDIAKPVSSGTLDIDRQNKFAIGVRHRRYCDVAWLARLQIAADDPWTREACSLVRLLSGTEAHSSAPAAGAGESLSR